MDRRVRGLLILLLFSSISLFCTTGYINFTVVYNNIPSNRELSTDWGISFFIEGLEKKVLFDTGGDGSILLSNMKKLGINPEEVEVVVLSHIHHDHTGGLNRLLKENDSFSVFLPNSFPAGFKKTIKESTLKVSSVKGPVEICENLWSTGEMGTMIKEQSLFIDTPEGIVIITGCAHPGIVNIVRFAKNFSKRDVYLVAGGFHLIAYSDYQVKEIISQLKELGVKKIAPSHCTGGRPIELFKEAWGDSFIELGCGARIGISKYGKN